MVADVIMTAVDVMNSNSRSPIDNQNVKSARKSIQTWNQVSKKLAEK